MEHIWFRKTANGLCWKPISWQGWAVTVVWAFANGWYLRKVDGTSHSISDTLLGYAVFFIVSTLVLLFVIRKRCDRGWT